MDDGKVTFTDNRIKVKEALSDISIAFLEEALGEIESQAARNTRVGQSQLKGKWKHTIDESKLEGKVGNPLENAIWEEYGTGEYALEKNGRKTAWYVPVDTFIGKKKPTYKGKVIIIYGKDGTAFYKTNGKRPNRALWNAYQSLESKIIKRAESIFKEMNNK